MVLLCCERLFVPAFVKTDIDRNIADQFIFGKENIFRIGDMRKNRLVLLEFYRDPGSGSFICVVDGIIQCLTGCFAELKIRKVSSVSSVSFLFKYSGIYKFHESYLLK